MPPLQCCLPSLSAAGVTLTTHGLDRRRSMARDGNNGRGCLVHSFAKEVQEELGLLVVPFEQRAVGCLGLARPSLRADLPATMSCFS